MDTCSNKTPDQFRKEIQSLYRHLLLRDRAKVSIRVKNIDRMPDEQLPAFHKYLDNLSAHSLEHLVKNLKCELAEGLPVTDRAAEISAAIRENPVVIVCGATGSGKTTQLPKIALSLGLGKYGKIGCTQPRRIAASALAHRFAAETGVEYGGEVGYKVRFDDHTDRRTVVKFMTDGILLAETRNDPNLLEYECLILDEVHERSLNIDFLLGYVKRLLNKRRNLKVIISSATLEAERISAFFNNAPVIEVEGRLFPIEDTFLPPEEDEELADFVVRAVEYLNGVDPHGDILVFLPGEREIRDCTETLENRNFFHTQLLPLFGRLSAGDQQKVFHPGQDRRIILATNVAETSLTIPGIRFVIDSGLVRLSRYNPRSRIQELQIEAVSKASARQRRGRCGRVQDGVCVHLYSEEAYAEYAEYTDPEIQRSSLAGVLLQMASLHLGPIEEFPLIDPPFPILIREGRQMLQDLLAFDENGRITPDGWKMADMPLDPHLAKMLMSAIRYKVLPEMLVITAWLSIPDPRERPFEEAAKADQAHRTYSNPDSDFLGVLVLHSALQQLSSNQAVRNFCKKNYYNYRRIREWRNLMDDLKDICKGNQWNCAGKIDLDHLSADAVHKALLCALPRQIGCYNYETNLFSDMKGKKFTIFPGSALAKRKKTPQWIMFSALVETSRVFARINAVIDPKWIEETVPHICSKAYDLVRWDENSGFVYAREKVMAGQLLVHPGRRCLYSRIHPDEAREVFIKEGLASGLANLKDCWLEGYSEMFRSLQQLELKMRKPDALLNIDAIIDHFEKVLPHTVNSVQTVKQDWLQRQKDYSPEPDDIVLIPFDELHEEEYPDTLLFSGVKFPLKYVYDPGEGHDGITMYVPQEMLNLLSPYCPDYLVPGYLREKVGYMLRSMSRTLRKLIMPLEEVADAFMEAYLDGEIAMAQSLPVALSSFIREFRGEEIDSEVFREMELPEYLVMKMAVRDKEGHIRIHRKFPSGVLTDSKLSHALPSVKNFHCKAGSGWPGGPLPETMQFSAKNPVPAYPALVAENETVSREMFLDEQEARRNHRTAILQLWRNTLPQIIKPLRNALRITHQMELEFFLEYPDWREDVIDLAVETALGGDLWNIRDPEDFRSLTEASRDTVTEEALNYYNRLERLLPLLQKVRELTERLREDSETEVDVLLELNLFFRPGFFKTPELFQQTERYLKALAVRVERAISSPEKDLTKGEYLQSYIRKFRLAADAVNGVEKSPGLLDFLLQLEECRISAYTPEIRTIRRCSEKILEQTWREMKLR